MAGSLFTIEYFSCPSCALPYSATKEEQPTKAPGSFACEVCGSPVHAWSGNYDFFDWQVDKADLPGVRETVGGNALTPACDHDGRPFSADPASRRAHEQRAYEMATISSS